MKLLASLLILMTLTGCIEAKNPNVPHSCAEKQKACGCPGTQPCQCDASGKLCCEPGSCTCQQVTDKK